MPRIHISQKSFHSVENIQRQFELSPIHNETSIIKCKWSRIAKKDPAKCSGEKSGDSPLREFVAKLSRGLMLPIAMLPIAGLFLGIGSAIVTQATANNIEWLTTFGKILQTPGNAIFSNLPVLFCIAVAITFAKDAGTAGLSAFVGWIVFCAFQSSIIISGENEQGKFFQFLWYHYAGNDINIYNAVFGSNLGIMSLNTSVFGGIFVGCIVAWLYNKYKNIQMPQILGFFSGVRFIPIVSFVAMIGLSLVFSIIWPVFGLGLYKFGSLLGSVPFGINSLFFGYIERALVPFGLHHAFYIPLWQTAAGGSIVLDDAEAWTRLLNELKTSAIFINGNEIHSWAEFAKAFGYNGIATIQGDQNCWAFVNGYIAGHHVQNAAGKDVILTFDHVKKCFDGVNPGQYMQGKYPFMMFGLPAAAAAIIFAAPKGEGRKIATSAVMGSAGTVFLTGITEPLEFTFLFLAPVLFYGFHAVFAAISFWLMNLFGAHMGMTFSGGAIDFTIYGVIGDIVGAQTNCWLAVIIGLGLVPLYLISFWWFIVKKDVKTPGREGASNKLLTKQDFLNKNKQSAPATSSASASAISGIDPSKLDKDQLLALEVIAAYGGKDNIKNVDACITKLRVQVKNPDIVNKDQLLKLGARGIIKPSKESVYAVFGNKADFIKNKMNELLNK